MTKPNTVIPEVRRVRTRKRSGNATYYPGPRRAAPGVCHTWVPGLGEGLARDDNNFVGKGK